MGFKLMGVIMCKLIITREKDKITISDKLNFILNKNANAHKKSIAISISKMVKDKDIEIARLKLLLSNHQ